MIIADTSIWIDHLRRPEPVLAGLLNRHEILVHPFITGEIALGSIANRDAMVEALSGMPQAPMAQIGEMLHFIKVRTLGGAGIGWVDANLLASALLWPGTRIWTRDNRLRSAAVRLEISFDPGQ